MVSRRTVCGHHPNFVPPSQSSRSLLNRTIKSTKAEPFAKDLHKPLQKNDDLQECILDEYLLLHLVRRNQPIFPSMKHHCRLSLDLKQFWLEQYVDTPRTNSASSPPRAARSTL